MYQLTLPDGPHARTTDPPQSHSGPTDLKGDAATVLQLLADNNGSTSSELGLRLLMDELDRIEESVPAGQLCASALIALMADPRREGPSPHRCFQMTNKRCSDLYSAGLVEKTVPRLCGATNSSAAAYVITDAGRDALDRLTR